MEKGCCELCSKVARMYCDSDEAGLCWDCDEKVHSANFIVSKHSRTLLCHSCQSLTPWKASGTKLVPTISLCHSCFNTRSRENGQVREAEDDRADNLGPDDHDVYSDREIEEGDAEEDAENQVVPWSYNCPSTSSSSAPPLATSFSTEHASFSIRDDGAAFSSALKRSHHLLHLDSDDEDVSCSSQLDLNTCAMDKNRASFSPLKMASAEEGLIHQPESEKELRRRRRRLELI